MSVKRYYYYSIITTPTSTIMTYYFVSSRYLPTNSSNGHELCKPLTTTSPALLGPGADQDLRTRTNIVMDLRFLRYGGPRAAQLPLSEREHALHAELKRNTIQRLFDRSNWHDL